MDAKPLIIVLIFVLILAVIASGIIGDVNLTDSGVPQPMSVNPPPGGGGSAGNQGLLPGGGLSSSSSGLSGGGQPVTGKSTSPLNSPCGSTYTVQSGDTLTKIARTCLISIEDLLAVNPSITNQNLISVGQKITIYNTLPVVTKQPTATQAPTVLSGVVATLPAGLKPGDTVNFEVKDLPANAQVRVGLVKVGKVPIEMKTLSTDANGVLKATYTIPSYAVAGEKWTVIVRTLSNPKIQMTAVPFTIQK